MLVRNLPGADPLRGDALYLLGRARWELGDVDGAREALREGVRSGVGRDRCLELLDRIELRESGIRKVPTEWSFDSGDHGFIHPWTYRDRGSIRVEPLTPSGPALAWSMAAGARTDHQIVLGFDHPDPTPRGARFIVWSTRIDAALRVLVFDTSGRRYTADAKAPVVHLPRGEPVLVEIDFATAEPLDPGRVPLDRDAIDRLVLQDVTSYYSSTASRNTLMIDDVEIY